MLPKETSGERVSQAVDATATFVLTFAVQTGFERGFNQALLEPADALDV